MALFQALYAHHPELCESEGDLRLLRAALLPPAGALCRHALHSVPVRPRRVLCARTPDAPDHHDALWLLLREGIQLRPLHRRRAGRAGEQVGRLLRRVVVPRRALGPVSYTHLTLPTSDLV